MKILVIRLSAIGDVILCSPLMQELRRLYPHAEINFLTKPEGFEIAKGISEVNVLHKYDVKPFHRSKALQSLRTQSWDIVVDLQNNLRSRSFVYKLKCTKLFRFKRNRWEREIRIHLPRMRDKLNTPKPVALQYIESIISLGAKDENLSLKLVLPKDWVTSAEKHLLQFVVDNQMQGHKPFLIIAPGAKHNTKQWLTEHWIEFCKLSHKNGMKTIAIIGAPNETQICHEIAEKVGFPVLNSAGRISLGEAAGLIQIADVVVCNDSSPMHISASLKTPIVAIFGATVPEFGFAPFNTQYKIVQDANLECRPCDPHGTKVCPLKHFKCMHNVKAEQVWLAVQEITSPKLLSEQTSNLN